MIQLLTRLLGALERSPEQLQAHIDTLQQWLPTAWQACLGEQLLLEATLDAGVTMLHVCHHSPPPLALLQVGLQLVDAAIQPIIACETGDGIGDSVHSSDGSGLLHAAAGLQEVTLRLWKAVLSALHPTLRAEPSLAAALSHLVQRLPLVLSLGDELLRPIMHVLDWHVLQDAVLQSCGGRFCAEHGAMVAALLEGAMLHNPERSGAIAALNVMHTILICAPHDAALLTRPLHACAATLLGRSGGGGSGSGGSGETTELVLAAQAGVLGRALLSAPQLFSSATAAVSLGSSAGEGASAYAGNVHATGIGVSVPSLPHLAARWLELVDFVLLSHQRKLAALALAQMLSLDATMLPLLAEVLSFIVGVLFELEPLNATAPAHSGVGAVGGASGAGPGLSASSRDIGEPQRRCESARLSSEHASFTRALEKSGLDPFRSIALRPALQQCVASAAAAHGMLFHAAMQRLDPELTAQVHAAFGGS